MTSEDQVLVMEKRSDGVWWLVEEPTPDFEIEGSVTHAVVVMLLFFFSCWAVSHILSLFHF